MKIIVMSDSHGDRETVRVVSERSADAYFHCGDSELSFDDSSFRGMYKVGGNCDFEPQLPQEVLATVEGKRIFMVHGHNHGIRNSLMNLYYAGKEHEADIVLFGHSHLYGAEMQDGMLFVNPGSTRLPRGGNEPTYAVIEWNEDINVEFRDMEHNLVKAVNFTLT